MMTPLYNLIATGATPVLLALILTGCQTPDLKPFADSTAALNTAAAAIEAIQKLRNAVETSEHS